MQAPSTIHITGTAYEFNKTGTTLAGATIRVAELPKLKAVVRSNGTYDLRVPAHAKVTPYIVAAGYHTIYLQTFTTAGENLVNVNFQTPTESVYMGLVALLHVPTDAQGNLKQCAIVSTFNTRNVRDLSYAGFIAYGAHGVAGAAASTSPALPKPVYFNASVIPDRTQKLSSKDGGVVWTNVPSGAYRVTAHDPATRFASFVATCRPGRVVNANPPWGLYQLSPANPAHVSATWHVHGAAVHARSLSAGALAPGSKIRASCSGRGCPFASRSVTSASGGRVDLLRALGGSLKLVAGDTLSVTISTHAFNGAVVRWTTVKGRPPKRTNLCVPDGFERPQARCATG